MKKTAAILPVSSKAYAGFRERIGQVITDHRKREAMYEALDKYLDGDVETYAGALTPDCAMAFEMLRFDIDQAITRSARARMRARLRKMGATPEMRREIEKAAADIEAACRALAESPACDDGMCDGEQKPFVAPLSRRQRRRRERTALPKTKWRKL